MYDYLTSSHFRCNHLPKEIKPTATHTVVHPILLAASYAEFNGANTFFLYH